MINISKGLTTPKTTDSQILNRVTINNRDNKTLLNILVSKAERIKEMICRLGLCSFKKVILITKKDILVTFNNFNTSQITRLKGFSLINLSLKKGNLMRHLMMDNSKNLREKAHKLSKTPPLSSELQESSMFILKLTKNTSKKNKLTFSLHFYKQ
jgi:hypothetical protein